MNASVCVHCIMRIKRLLCQEKPSCSMKEIGPRIAAMTVTVTVTATVTVTPNMNVTVSRSVMRNEPW